LPGWRKICCQRNDTLVEKFLKELRRITPPFLWARFVVRCRLCLTGRRFFAQPAAEIAWTQEEDDLVGLAQFYLNSHRGTASSCPTTAGFVRRPANPHRNHKILARLPIRTYWTTN